MHSLSFLDVNRAQLRALSKSNSGKFESTENRLQGYIYCQEPVIRKMQLPYLAYATAFRQISLFIWYARNRRNRLNLSFLSTKSSISDLGTTSLLRLAHHLFVH